MLETESDCFVLYPVYLDKKKTQAQGRKYNKNLCIDYPSYSEMLMALKSLDIECIEEPSKRHPRDFLNFGRFKIKKMYGKKNIIEGLSQTILSLRNQPKTQKVKEQPLETEKVESFITSSKGEVIENKLNLVPKRKDKKKLKKK